jgi:hypothetical protein
MEPLGSLIFYGFSRFLIVRLFLTLSNESNGEPNTTFARTTQSSHAAYTTKQVATRATHT